MSRKKLVKSDHCENIKYHRFGFPDEKLKLKRVYTQTGDHMCYAWWCKTCRDGLDGSLEFWPVAANGRFMESRHCE